MSLTNPTRPDAPIPGANYTSDTRNYPWHRPPDITNVDEALEHVMERLTETDDGLRYMSLIEAGAPITSIADIVVTLAVGRGKFTPDFAVLIAGPVARMLEIMAKSYNIEYELGIEESSNFTTPVAYKQRLKGTSPQDDEGNTEDSSSAKGNTEDSPEEGGGLMSAVSEEEQANMLGYDVEELEEDE